MFSKTLGGKLFCINYLRQGNLLITAIKYALQSFRTLQILIVEKPMAVHVQNPPVICSLIVYIYCYLSGGGYVIDHHSAAFGSVWDWALPVQKKLARAAMVNIITNQFWADIVQSWDAEALIMGDAILDLPEATGYPVSDEFNIAFISTYSLDEPFEEVFDAAKEVRDVQFYITGDSRGVKTDVLDHIPSNVILTGFLPEDQYVGLLRSVDGVMVLTTRDHTLQMGGCEAVAVGQPIITSDWPFLKKFFNLGTVHVKNDADSIRDGINHLRTKHDILKREISELRLNRRQEWENQLSELRTHAENLGQG